MKHAYLTKEEISNAYQLGGITVTEVKELLADLERCALRSQALMQAAVKQNILKEML